MNRGANLWKSAGHLLRNGGHEGSLGVSVPEHCIQPFGRVAKRCRSELAVRDSTAATLRQLMVDTMSLVSLILGLSFLTCWTLSGLQFKEHLSSIWLHEASNESL